MFARKALHMGLRLSPYFVGLAFFIIGLSFALKTPLGKSLGLGVGWAVAASALLAAVCGGASYLLLRRLVLSRRLRGVEPMRASTLRCRVGHRRPSDFRVDFVPCRPTTMKVEPATWKGGRSYPRSQQMTIATAGRGGSW